ncbi:myosin-9-like [Ostrinia furnacalis]|uniref:myosin-9-like n=1 Tax=Ostrinia furnacalis TaxID=93504 RepID=UPI00103E53F8|nr:myosin-9-like [Ostrinia furnacalis]
MAFYLINTASKRKLQKDIEGLQLRNLERQYSEELTTIATEIELTTEQLTEQKNMLSLARHQISLVEICTTSEKSKIQNAITELNDHKRSFVDEFDKVRVISEMRKRELKQSEENELELLRQREKETEQKNEQILKQIICVEKECDDIERECAVLKKRNHAIMLKMRRKLVETENVRKELMKNN